MLHGMAVKNTESIFVYGVKKNVDRKLLPINYNSTARMLPRVANRSVTCAT